jgi:hypothetical protein
LQQPFLLPPLHCSPAQHISILPLSMSRRHEGKQCKFPLFVYFDIL